MDDLIDRQAAIDAVAELASSMSVCISVDECHGMKRMQGMAVRALDNLPSAQPNKELEKTGEWEMFELITSVYHGKQYYFKQENGIVYSRASCKYMSVDDAVKEFLDVIGE